MQTMRTKGWLPRIRMWAVLLAVAPWQYALALGTNWYVSATGTGAGTNGWPDATNNLQGAINSCGVSDTVWLAAGEYATGGVTNYPTKSTLTNRIAITKAITVRGATTNASLYLIRGNWDPVVTNSSVSVRCVYMAAGAKLMDLTVTNGATFAYGTPTNSDSQGSGIYCADATTAIISNCIVACNASTGYGNGGVGAGGGVYQGVLFGCTLRGNFSSSGGGANNSVLSNCTIVGNCVRDIGSAVGLGGGVNGCTVYSSTIAANTNAGGSGSGAGASGGTLYGCMVSNNVSAGTYAGGANGGTLYGCTLVENSSKRAGGAYSATLYNCLLARNRCSDSYASAAYGCALYNCTITANRNGTTAGAALYDCSVITNSVIYFNTNSANSVVNYNTGSTNFIYSCTYPAKTGWDASNTTNNPKLVNFAAGDYHLTRPSPCVNTGTNFSWVSVASDPRSKDLDGRARMQGDAVDMGAYEYPMASGTTVLFR